MSDVPVLLVPGLRDAVATHWQTLLEARLPRVYSVPPMGRADLDCGKRVEAIDRALAAIPGAPIVVAHSGGVIMFVHWARRYRRPIGGALFATPPDFEQVLPDGYPTIDALRAGGWLPVPREKLPFRSIVAGSRSDPLARYERVAELAHAWGSRLDDLGDVGHLNPASSYGPWPRAERYIEELAAAQLRALPA